MDFEMKTNPIKNHKIWGKETGDINNSFPSSSCNNTEIKFFFDLINSFVNEMILPWRPIEDDDYYNQVQPKLGIFFEYLLKNSLTRI